MAHQVDIHVGLKLKQARAKLRMSQTDIARALGLSFQQVQKYEMGTNRISASRLFELAGVLGVSTSYFFEGLVEEKPTPADSTMDIVRAITMIKDEQLKSRIIRVIQDFAGNTVPQAA